MRRLVIAIAVALWITTAFPGLASASPAWTLAPPVDPTGANGSQQAISCHGTTFCMAVGDYFGATGASQDLAEIRNGTAWTITSVPKVSGSLGSNLDGVACLSSTDCVAVGAYTNGSGDQRALAGQWNGSIWKVEPTPAPATDSTSYLLGVSCLASNNCVAIGFGSGADPDAGFADTWNGTSWSLRTTALIAGVTESVLEAVSCSSGKCMAVGWFDASGSDTPAVLAEVWNGSTWTLHNPASSSVTGPQLEGVSCTSATSCMAVGISYGTGAFEIDSLSERWNGTSWTIESTPATGSTWTQPDAVSCSSATYCVSVGTVAGAPGFEPLAERWNGTSWARESVSSPVAGYLGGISCWSSSACVAAGDSSVTRAPLAVAELWNGTTMTEEKPKNGSGVSNTTLNSVSCLSSDCMAVGYGINGLLAERWNGSSWAVSAAPAPANASYPTFDGDSCTSATTCVAVGEYKLLTTGSDVSLAESWNGTAWSVKTTPNPSGGHNVELQAVSCVSSRLCMAVGSYDNASYTALPVADVWNGTAWSATSLPIPSGSIGTGTVSVSCPTSVHCIAVGSYEKTAGDGLALSYLWNGSTWTAKTAANPGAATETKLNSVSCLSVSDCVAVGTWSNSSNYSFTLAEKWNGSTWTIESTPNVSGSFETELEGVSCRSAGCTAVGYSEGSMYAEKTVVETSPTGVSWTLVTSPNPAGAPQSQLLSVSFTSTICMATGDNTNASQTSVPLAEHS